MGQEIKTEIKGGKKETERLLGMDVVWNIEDGALHASSCDIVFPSPNKPITKCFFPASKILFSRHLQECLHRAHHDRP